MSNVPLPFLLARHRNQLLGAWNKEVQRVIASPITSRQYYLPDGMGNIRYVTSSTGTVLSNMAYDAYGQQTGGSTTLTNYAYQSEQKDPDSSLIFLRARYYDPMGAVKNHYCLSDIQHYLVGIFFIGLQEYFGERH